MTLRPTPQHAPTKDDTDASEGPDETRPTIAVVGAGPAGLMAAEIAAAGGAAVIVFDRMPSVGRKFLLAGRGGLNLTHSEPFDRFLTRYGTAAAALRPALDDFPPEHLRAWCADLGQPTFVGSSGRVFPASFKTSPLLRAWLRRLDAAGVSFRLRHRWSGWQPDGTLVFDTSEGRSAQPFDALVLAMGGASWPQLGSDGNWMEGFTAAQIATAPLRPSNCGFVVAWSDLFRDRFEGQPLKSIRLAFGDGEARGDAVVTRSGLEGGAVYALSGPIRDAITEAGSAEIQIALRPDMSRERLADRLAERPTKQSLSTHLRKALHLTPVATGLLQEAAHRSGLALSAMDAAALAALINAVPLRLIATAPIDRAISSAGGVRFAELDGGFMLRRRPGTFLAGEMIDWEAPTGGYLLQGCFATGAAAGRGALAYARERRATTA